MWLLHQQGSHHKNPSPNLWWSRRGWPKVHRHAVAERRAAAVAGGAATPAVGVEGVAVIAPECGWTKLLRCGRRELWLDGRQPSCDWDWSKTRKHPTRLMSQNHIAPSHPTTTWPCPSTKKMVKPVAPGGTSGDKKDLDNESISNLPCSVRNAPTSADCLRLTFISIPLPLRTPIPRCHQQT